MGAEVEIKYENLKIKADYNEMTDLEAMTHAIIQAAIGAAKATEKSRRPTVSADHIGTTDNMRSKTSRPTQQS